MSAMWGQIAQGVTQLVGSYLQYQGARDAAGIQKEATQAAINEQQRQFNVARNDLMPWRDVGTAGVLTLGDLMGLGGTIRNLQKGGSANADGYIPIGRIGSAPAIGTITENPAGGYQKLVMHPGGKTTDNDGNPIDLPPQPKWVSMPDGYQPPAPAGAEDGSTTGGVGNAPLTRRFTMEDFQNDPVMQASFDFGMSEGEKAVKRMFGARGLSRSGAAVKAATRFAVDYGSQKAGESRDRFVQDQTNLYNRLAGVSGTGQTAATNNANAAMTTGANNAQLMVGAGNAGAASVIAGNNAIAGGMNNASKAYNDNYWMNRILSSGSSNTSSGGGSSSSGGSNDYGFNILD